MKPLECVNSDMIGTLKVKIRLTETSKGTTVKLKSLSMLDRATIWPEIKPYKEQSAFINTERFNIHWLHCCPIVDRVVYGNGP